MNGKDTRGPGLRDDDAGDEEGEAIRIPKVRSWSDIVALTTIFGLFFAGIVWGMKLEGRYDHMDSKVEAARTEAQQGLALLRSDIAEVAADVSEIKVLLQRGILPVAEERTHSLEERIQKLESKKHVGDG